MNKKPLQFSRKYHQFKSLSKKINYLIVSGKFNQLKESTRIKLIRKLNFLYGTLIHHFSSLKLKKILAVAAIFIGLSATNKAFSQPFLPPTANPFGLSPSLNFIPPTLADLDNDGDLDLMGGYYGGDFFYYENNGTANAPSFANANINPFNLKSVLEYAFPAFVDIDNDGDFDLFAGEYYGNIQFFRNKGTASAPDFANAQKNPFGLEQGVYLALPTFVDIDDDGDFDLFSGDYDGVINYYKNTGTAQNPAFDTAVVNAFNLKTAYNYISFPTFTDFDNDSDMDLMVGDYYGNFLYYENIGSKTSPHFANPTVNPFGLKKVEEINLPVFADLDNDGDPDILANSYDTLPSNHKFRYFENDSPVGFEEKVLNAGMVIFPNPAQNELQINLTSDGFNDQIGIEIYDAKGMLVINRKSEAVGNNFNETLSIKNLPPGVYWVKILADERSIVQKFTKF